MMSSLTPLINYLKIFRRNDHSQKNEKYIEGSILDENYKDDEADLKVVIEKEKLSESIYFTELNSIIAGYTSFFIKINTEEPFYDYFIQREIPNPTNGELAYEYKNIFGNSWLNLSDSLIELPIVSSADNYYYSHDSKRVVLLPLNTIFGFPDWLVYHPNAIPEITNDDYTFNYKDHEGYTNDALDFTFRFILEPVVEFINNLRKRTVDVEKSQIPGKMYLYPHITTEMNKYVLYYNFVGTDKTFFKTAQNPYAIRLEFNYLGAMLEFLNQTIFYEADSISFDEGSGSKKYFFERYKRLVNAEIQYALQKNIANVLEILYYTPKLFLKEINTNTLWDILEKSITGKSLTNIGLNEEDVVVVLLEALSEIEKTENIFLLKLIEEKQDKKSYFSLLYEKMNGENFVQIIQLLYNIWLKSSFINFDNPYYTYDEGSLLIPYKSNKFAGFYSSNRNFNFKNGKQIEVSEDESWIDNIISVFDPNLGDYVNQIVEEQNKFSYHLFQPLMLTDIKQESPIPLPKLLPAFFLKANEDKAYWSNVITGIEYTVDAITTLSGFGNLAKFRHLQRIVKVATKYKFFDKAKKFNYLAKIRFGVSAIEISSGSLNALLKLTGLADTKFGKALTEYLFWLELLSLGGELTVAIKGGLRKSAKEVLEHTDELKKTAKNADELKQIDEVIEHLKIVANEAEKISYVPLRFDKLYSISGAALDTALNVSKNIFFYLKNLTKANTETVFYKGVEIFTDSPAKVKVFLDDAAKVLKTKGVEGVEQFFELTGSVLSKKRLHSQTGETFICNLVRKKEMNKYYYYEIEDFQYGVKNWNRKQTLRSERFECFVTLADKPSISETIGKNILYADLYVPKALNDTFQANKLDLTDISLGKAMLDDGYAVLKKDLGKDLDGIYGEWLNNPGYKDFGGESVNLTKLKEAMGKQKITKENLEIAAMETVTGKWAKSKGFTKAMVLSKSNVYEFLDDDINRLKQLEVIFIK